MLTLLILVGALIALWLFSNWFTRTKPSLAARTLKKGAFAVLVVLGLWLVMTGKLAGLFAVAAGLTPWIMRAMRAHALWQTLRRFGIQMKGGRPSPGTASEVETRFVRMMLDHDSGVLDGEVLDGTYRGRRLSALSEAQAVELWREVQADAESARVVEAWIERAWPDWREAREPQAPASAAMSVDEAREILGVAAGANADDIRAAHRRLMLANHPDHGGSTWIAARINQARDLLLGGSKA
jgi:hypothetical protein